MASRRFLLRHPLQPKSHNALSFSLALVLEDLPWHRLSVISSRCKLSCQERDNIESPRRCNIIIGPIWATVLVTGCVRLMTPTVNLMAFQQVYAFTVRPSRVCFLILQRDVASVAAPVMAFSSDLAFIWTHKRTAIIRYRFQGKGLTLKPSLPDSVPGPEFYIQ
jgi:hypothetical protein